MSSTNIKPPIYDAAAVQPMRDELIYAGFEEALTPEAVDAAINEKNGKSVLFFVNSVCGCAAGSARPGVTLALQSKIIPDRFITSFAGQERDAIEHLREKYLSEFPPSSPCVALFKDGELKYMMPRIEIEGREPEEIADTLREQFEIHCSNQGPSISPEKYSKLVHSITCGSKIPLN